MAYQEPDNQDDIILTPTEAQLQKDWGMDHQEILRAHPIYDHIHRIWPQLTFTHDDLFLGGANNPLHAHRDGDPYYIYISDKEDLEDMRAFYAKVKERVLQRIRNGEITDKTEDEVLDIEVRYIPKDKDGKRYISYYEHGILHIPERGVSPGLDRFLKGIFFYWDTTFMIRGMIQDGMADLAKDMLDNLLYEIDHYNGPLNANSTFCLSIGEDGNIQKPRSQLPLIAAQILNIYRNWDRLDFEQKESPEEWLKRALVMVEKHYEHWTTGRHLDDKTGLSKFDTGHIKPGVEVMHAEPEHYMQAYIKLKELYERSRHTDTPLEERSYQERKDLYYVALFLECDKNGDPVPFSIDMEKGDVRGLTKDFFRGDWAMRESGFDPSRRFGYMNVDIINHLPVCLNMFRWKMEEELAEMYDIIAETDLDNPDWIEGAQKWSEKAQATKKAIRKYLWDDARPQYDWEEPDRPDDPMYPCYRDLNINPVADEYQVGKFRRYNFVANAATALWTGVATQDQARVMIEKTLPLFEREFGLMTSTRRTGCQWDGPISFSVNEIMFAEGAELYGFYHTALRLREKRKRALEREFERTGELWEKNEVIHGTCNTAQFIGEGIGYNDNDRGFGWTNSEYIDCVIAIERLKQKISGDYKPGPCVTSNFVIYELLPIQDEPQS